MFPRPGLDEVLLLQKVGRPVKCGLGGRPTGAGFFSDGVGGRGGNDVLIAALAAKKVGS